MTPRAPLNAARTLLLVWLISGTIALAQQSSVEVRSPSAKLLETAPGRIVTATVVVANRGGEADEFSERLTLPPGCQQVAPPDLPFRLESGGQMVRVLAVLIPPKMPAGQFPLRYAVQSRRDLSSMGSVDLLVQVTPIGKLDLVIEPRSNVVFAGDNYPVKLSVTNGGNSRINVKLTHRSSLGFPVSADASAFPLEAGASREITCSVKTDKAFPKHTNHSITFEATAVSPTGTLLTASQAAIVEIIPLVSGNRDPFHHLPMELRLIGIAETGHGTQSQTELSGAGSLDEAGKHRVDFLFRGPDVQNVSFFGERDEYGASYHGDNWDVDGGDRVFSLSPLTEKYSFGRGAGVKWHNDDARTSAGVFYMSTRYRQQNSHELGAFLRRDFTKGFSLEGNFLRKTGGDLFSMRALPQNIVSLESHYRLEKLLDLRLEVAGSRSDEGVTDFAYRVEAHGELPGKLSYAIEYVHAGPDFHGYYSDTDTTSASVVRPLTPQLRAHASFNRYAGNLALADVRSSVVNRQYSWNSGLNYSLTKKTELFLEWQYVKRADILLPAAYDFTEDSARIGVRHNFGTLHLQSFLDLGTLDNLLTGENGPFQRYSGTANWQPTVRQTYSVFASYGPSAFTGSTEQSLNVGISTRWQVRDNLTANLTYARNQYDGLTGREQDQGFAALRYQFENKSSLSVAARWSRAITKGGTSSATNEAAILVTYSIPLSVPVSRKHSIGALQGRVCDPKGAGLPRVVLEVGEQFAVTDEAGAFEFPELKPGSCELRVVADSLGARLVMATPLPMKIKIRPAETTRIALSTTPACSLSVRVTRYEFAGDKSVTGSDSLLEAGGQEAVTVEITNGRDVWRAQTDRTGTASFDRLPGGSWKLRVAGKDLPALHTIENPERPLALKPDESPQVVFRLLPQRRTIRLLDRGTIR